MDSILDLTELIYNLIYSMSTQSNKDKIIRQIYYDSDSGFGSILY